MAKATPTTPAVTVENVMMICPNLKCRPGAASNSARVYACCGAPNTCADGDRCGNQEVTQVQIEATGVEFID